MISTYPVKKYNVSYRYYFILHKPVCSQFRVGTRKGARQSPGSFSNCPHQSLFLPFHRDFRALLFEKYCAFYIHSPKHSPWYFHSINGSEQRKIKFCYFLPFEFFLSPDDGILAPARKAPQSIYLILFS